MYYDFIVTLIEYWLYRDIEYILALSWHHIKLSWMPWLSMGRADWWRRADGADGADGAVTPIQQRWVRAAGRRSHSFFCRPEKTWRMKPRHWRDRTINPGINPTRSSEKKNPEEPSTLWISRQNRSSRTRPVSREKRSALLFFNRTEVVVCGRGSAEVRQRLSGASFWLSHDFSRVLVLFSGSRSCWGETRGREAEQSDACVGRAAQPETLWAPEPDCRFCRFCLGRTVTDWYQNRGVY